MITGTAIAETIAEAVAGKNADSFGKSHPNRVAFFMKNFGRYIIFYLLCISKYFL